MTGDQLREAGIRLFGERGWQSSLASALGMERTQIWRYVTNNSVPGPVGVAVTLMIEKLELQAKRTKRTKRTDRA